MSVSRGSKRWAEPADADAFFADNALGRSVFAELQDLVGRLGGAELRVAATQVGWARRRGFATLWCPRRWLGARGSDLVLTVHLSRRDGSPRWKQVVEVRPGLWAHHLEIATADDIDAEVVAWFARAYEEAGCGA